MSKGWVGASFDRYLFVNLICTGSLSLEKAKENIRNKFILIGLTGDLNGTIKLLEKMMPDWFDGLRSKFENGIDVNRTQMITKHLQKPSKEVYEYLVSNMKYEIELYEWIKKRFKYQKWIYGIE